MTMTRMTSPNVTLNVSFALLFEVNPSKSGKSSSSLALPPLRSPQPSHSCKLRTNSSLMALLLQISLRCLAPSPGGWSHELLTWLWHSPNNREPLTRWLHYVTDPHTDAELLTSLAHCQVVLLNKAGGGSVRPILLVSFSLEEPCQRYIGKSCPAPPQSAYSTLPVWPPDPRNFTWHSPRTRSATPHTW